jgi:hypothetical protein
MNNTKNSNFKISHLGHFVFAVLIFFSLYFWQERTLILDAAFQSYLFISTGYPAIMVERFGAGSTHLLPLIGVYLGFSLKSVLILYSLSIVLFHYVLFIICQYVLKNSAFSLAIVLFNVFLIGDAFFWMQNELLQGITLMFVMWAFFIKKQEILNFHWWDYLIGIGLVITVVYYHPLIVFPLSFVWLFLFIQEKPIINKQLLMIIAASFILIFISKYAIRQPNFYDRGMTSQFVKEFNFSITNFINSVGFKLFKNHLFSSFIFLIPIYLWVSLFYLKNKKYKQVILVNVFCISYFILITQRYLEDTRWYSAECHYQPLAVFLIIPFVFDVLPAIIVNKRSVILGFIAFFAIMLFTIFNTYQSYTDRLHYIENLLNKPTLNGFNKIILEEKNINKEKLMMTWAMPFESMQISSLKAADSTKIVVIAENGLEKQNELLNSKDSMVTFLMLPKTAFKDLPKTYYNVPNTEGYRFINEK